MRRPVVRVLAPLTLVALLVPVAAASAHPERPTQFPDPKAGEVPSYRSKGSSLVVCKRESLRLIRKAFAGDKDLLSDRAKLLKRCRYRHIQRAVNAAKSGDRILILPGTYREEPSRRVPHNQEEGCPPDGMRDPGDGHGLYAIYEYHLACPNSRNLIAILGDSNNDGRCDAKCNLQVEGMGRKPTDVVIEGDRVKEDTIRADRTDGIFIKNLTVEEGAFNAIDVVESNGFRLSDLEARDSQNYGVLSFTSDNGLYEDIEAYGNGDSGIYPGSGPERHCASYGIEIRRVNSHHNVLGYSGTAGNGTWTHDSKFHHNSAGISDDSFASGHPGMPQDCSKWEDNKVYSNNVNYFTAKNQAYCAETPYERLPQGDVCPQFQVPVGSGFVLYGVNDNIVRRNYIYDNWRSGVRLFWVPGTIRGDDSPEAQFDTSNGNRFTRNSFGRSPADKRMPNGEDVFWDEQGRGNCWSDNTGADDKARLTSDPARLPACPGSAIQLPPTAKTAAEVPCGDWDVESNPLPVGCTWFATPEKPK
jgi:Periplasmic copper-binding protein (NosD)